MKFIGIGVAAIILCGAAAEAPQAFAQQAHDYWFIGWTHDNTLIDYVDAGSIASLNGDLKRAWTWAFHSKSAPQFSGLHSAALMEVNCRTRQTHSLQVNFYDDQGQNMVAMSENVPEQWSYAVPGSFGESELNFICSPPAVRSSFGMRLPQGNTLEQSAQKFFAVQDDTKATSSTASANH